MRKFITISVLLIIGLLYCGNLYSQPVVQWFARYNGLQDSTDISNDITIDNAGNTYVTGFSYTLLGLLTSAVTISYGPNGNQRWKATFDQFPSLTNDEGTAIVFA